MSHDTEINNSKKVKQTNPITNSKTNTSNKNKINLNENIQKHNKVLVSEVKDDNNNNIHNSDLNANDILILHLNKNRKVGKEVKNHFYLLENDKVRIIV